MKHVLAAILIAATSFASATLSSADELARDDGKADIARANVFLLRQAMMSYRNNLGTFPKGDYGTIMKVLTSGDNFRRIIFFNAPEKQFNPNGEFLDPWGTPYRIGSFPSKSSWAYSCGPNKIDEGGGEYSDDIASWR